MGIPDAWGSGKGMGLVDGQGVQVQEGRGGWVIRLGFEPEPEISRAVLLFLVSTRRLPCLGFWEELRTTITNTHAAGARARDLRPIPTLLPPFDSPLLR